MAPQKTFNILGIPGSLRKESYNKALLKAAKELLPPDVNLEIIDLSQVPLYNQDLEIDLPKAVSEFKNKVRTADAILFATPEYNYSIPGVLKNAIDWGSRPYGQNAWDEKPAAIMGASIGMLGTGRAQYHLRQVFVFVNMHTLNKPEVLVPFAKDKFDETGKLIDPHTREKIKELTEALVTLAAGLKSGQAVRA